MPTISINQAYFNQLISHQFTMEELDEICFNFGLEVEEDKENPGHLKVEIPANRYDLLSVEGLALTISNYLFSGSQKALLPANTSHKCNPHATHVDVDPIVKTVRGYVVAGIIRNVTFTQESYDSFIDLQDKLHHNLGRRRTLVSIGTHDLDKVKAPFKYTAKKREDFSFVPLNQTKEFRGDELLKFYENDPHLKVYLPIIQNSEVIPLILDAENRVLSMPPIINSHMSRLTLDTKNVFIEITATDKTKALMALNVILSNFSLYSSDKFSFEQVEIRDQNETFVSPITPLQKSFNCPKDYLERIIGMPVDGSQVPTYLAKMGLNVTSADNENFTVAVPFYRTDVMHPCDIAEDLAIAIGYNNVPFIEPNVICLGKQYPLNKMSELARVELAVAGFHECLNFSLCSTEEITKKMLKDKDELAIEIANPKTLDFQVGRTSLIPGIIKSLVANKSHELPLKLFEIGDIILLRKAKAGPNSKPKRTEIGQYFGDDEEIGAFNERRICIAHSNNSSSGLDIVHGAMDLLFTKLFGTKINYELRENKSPYLFLNLQSAVYVNGEKIGEMGILHPEVLKINKWPYPTSVVELDFEKLCEIFYDRNA